MMRSLEKYICAAHLGVLTHCSDSQIKQKWCLKTFFSLYESQLLLYKIFFLTGKGKGKGAPKGKKDKGLGLKGKESKEAGKKAGTEEKTEAKGAEAKPETQALQ